MQPSTKGNIKTLTSWSYSVYTQWLKCPFSVFLDKIARIRITEPSSPMLDKGNNTHAVTQVYVQIKAKPTKMALVKAAIALIETPDSMTGKITKADAVGVTAACTDILGNSQVVTRLDDLRKHKADLEGELAFDVNYQRVSWRDWHRAWLRVKCDVIKSILKPKPVVNIIDWKTGKVHDEHKQQRSLYALAGLQLVQLGHLNNGDKDTEVVAEHIYTDTGQSATETFAFSKLAALKREWAGRIKFMMADTKFPAKPGFACRYCKFGKSKGGPCEAEQL